MSRCAKCGCEIKGYPALSRKDKNKRDGIKGTGFVIAIKGIVQHK